MTVEIVSFPMNSMVDLPIGLCKRGNSLHKLYGILCTVWYPLVICYIAMENGPFIDDKYD